MQQRQASSIATSFGLRYCQGSLKRAIERGLERRETDQITHIGIEEKSFLREHNDVLVMPDIFGFRFLEVVEGRTEEATDSLWKTSLRKKREMQHSLEPSRCGCSTLKFCRSIDCGVFSELKELALSVLPP